MFVSTANGRFNVSLWWTSILIIRRIYIYEKFLESCVDGEPFNLEFFGTGILESLSNYKIQFWNVISQIAKTES